MVSPYLTSELVEELRSSIIGKVCKNKCSGHGTLLINYSFQECVCVKELAIKLKLVEAGIPKKYWNFDLRNLLKRFVDDNTQALELVKGYANKLTSLVNEGIGLYIAGESGLAKSSLGCYILKEAVKKDVKCCWIRMSQLTKLLVEGNLHGGESEYVVRWIKKDVKLLMVDEIEKDYKVDNPSSFSGSVVNDFFSYMYDNRRALIITSNLPKDRLHTVHSSNIVDRFAELADVILVGSSFRGQKEAISKILETKQKD